MDKYKKVLKILFVIFVLNITIAIVKLFIGYKLNITSLIADGYYAITDAASNVIGIIGIKLASKPADKEHPYGYYKFETIAGFIIGILLLGIISKIIINAISSIINPSDISIKLSTIITLLFTITFNTFIATYEYRLGKKLNSDVLISDSIHTRSDIFISSGVVITIVLIMLGLPQIIDPIFSLLITLFVFKSCYEILKMTIGILVDKKTVDEELIRSIIKSSDNLVIDVIDIRSRGNLANIYLDFKLLVKSDVKVSETSYLKTKIEKVLEEKLFKNVDIFFHLEPVDNDIENIS